MTFFDRLKAETETARQELFSAPILGRALHGRIDRSEYLAFLAEAYHHVRHTVPLLMATGSRLPAHYEWLREAVAEYIEEELGHQEWILDDIAAAGGDADAVRHGVPGPATELMVAYAYDMVYRVNPVGFFGMVHVLEGTSIDIAQGAADAIRPVLGLPKNAFRYLYSHGALDQDHVKFFEGVMNRIVDPDDQHCIIHSARQFYRLYGGIFRSLDPGVRAEAA